MSLKKRGAIRKAKKRAPAFRKRRSSEIIDFNKMLDTFRTQFRGYLWDPFRGFEWPIEHELPMRIPYVDVIDSGNEYVVKAELPGVKSENVEIEVGTNELSLTAKSDLQKEAEGKTYLHRERAFSTFHRHIGFGESIDTQQVSAKMVEGILEMRLPKLGSRPEKKTRKVTIQ